MQFYCSGYQFSVSSEESDSLTGIVKYMTHDLKSSILYPRLLQEASSGSNT